MVVVSAGSFMMGCNIEIDDYCDPGDDDPYNVTNELPYHEVWLCPFEIDRTEVTRAAYAECVGEGICSAPEGFDPEAHPDHPVRNVEWDQARTYCEWAGKRLPTEAEWEKAARGTDGRKYPWGNDVFSAMCEWVVCGGDTAAVDSRHPDAESPYGARDMASNVWEWVNDFYGPGYYEESPRQNPPGPPGSGGHLRRGGGFDSTEVYYRTSVRDAGPLRAPDLGFRCAR